MTYIIETAEGRFEADDERGAKRLLRAAKREAAARAKQREADYSEAARRAESNGYKILVRKLEGRAFHQLAPAGKPCGPIVNVTSAGFFTSAWEALGGTVVLNHSGYRPTHAIIDGAGFTIGIVLVDADHPDRAPEMYALGACGEATAYRDLPGMTWLDFKQ